MCTVTDRLQVFYTICAAATTVEPASATATTSVEFQVAERAVLLCRVTSLSFYSLLMHFLVFLRGSHNPPFKFSVRFLQILHLLLESHQLQLQVFLSMSRSRHVEW